MKFVFCIAKDSQLYSKMSSTGLLITRSNIHELTPDNILSFSSKEYWHKFILKNGGLFDKEVVLEAVLESINPFDVVPVKYTVSENDSYFLARNCEQAIEKFILNLLQPIQLYGIPGEVTVNILTCYLPIEDYKVNMQTHLKKAIEKRYDNSQKGFINLSSFHREPELFDILYCPLSKPRFLMYVLSILKRIFPVEAIDLSNNNIEILKPLEVLKEFEGLTSLDLSRNQIKDYHLVELLRKATPKLQEFNLRGNPICYTFKKELDYVQWIKTSIPSIRRLDGLVINNGLPQYQVWMCSNKASPVVNEFLKHYFTLYDHNRRSLEHTYDRNAIFSMTCDHLPSENKDLSLECYQNESKNLLKVNFENKIMGVSHNKNTDIVNVLSKLPPSEHDPYSFKVDVLLYQNTFMVLVVSGLFLDIQEVPSVRSFSRTFALNKVSDEEYKITNDMYHVRSATYEQVNSAFLNKKPVERVERMRRRIVTREEEQNLVEIVSRLTEMNSSYSKRCLEDCNWDVKKALEIFLENFEVFNIPPEAFYDTNSD